VEVKVLGAHFIENKFNAHQVCWYVDGMLTAYFCELFLSVAIIYRQKWAIKQPLPHN